MTKYFEEEDQNLTVYCRGNCKNNLRKIMEEFLAPEILSKVSSPTPPEIFYWFCPEINKFYT